MVSSLLGAPLGADEWLASDSAEPALLVAGVPMALASLGPSETWRAPAAIRAALRRLPACDREVGIDLRDLPVSDLGDWDVAGLGPDDGPGVVERHAREMAGGPPACFIGGDEAVLAPLVTGLAGGAFGDVGVLTVGAHTAPRPEPGWAIAEVIRRGVAPGRVMQVGIHATGEVGAPPGIDIEIVTMGALDEVGAGWVVTSSLNDLAETCGWVFVGIDVGALDLAYAPGCRGARPGGMTPRQLAAASRAAGAHRVVRAADLVGVDPASDPSGLTVMNAATALLAFAAGVAMRKAV